MFFCRKKKNIERSEESVNVSITIGLYLPKERSDISLYLHLSP